jgi:hypothetical protein
MAWAHEQTVPTKWPPLVGEVNANFIDSGCHAVSMMDPYGHILGFLDQNRYFFFQVAPEVYSQGWMDSVDM